MSVDEKYILNRNKPQNQICICTKNMKWRDKASEELACTTLWKQINVGYSTVFGS